MAKPRPGAEFDVLGSAGADDPHSAPPLPYRGALADGGEWSEFCSLFARDGSVDVPQDMVGSAHSVPTLVGPRPAWDDDPTGHIPTGAC